MGKGLPIREPGRSQSEAECVTAPLTAHICLGGVEAIFWLVLTILVFAALVLDPLVFRLVVS